MKKDLNKSQELVLLTINQLTSNEDERQDLWVAFLSGVPQDLLPAQLPALRISDCIEDNFKQQIQQLLLNPPSQAFIDYLTETECIVVCLLMIGCDLSMISKYTGIMKVRIHQIMVAIKDSKAREKLQNGTQEKSE